ncbi:ArsR family transcriptional regulator [Paenibacillus selenitireducens]|uniref:DNA topoisomerase (ATP-hydrolyzing) n=1 Tax=Paenibacillus selenitireducens TaxID=1324314 RepID=A0A1T2XHV7_9BACL|nr:ATP-binding protein [Paenibacillus selenitireducens]OPA79243.1 ArsR family transcriptional regulator [Paenibacillus selenitireducens]
MSSRDYGVELDTLKAQMNSLQKLMEQIMDRNDGKHEPVGAKDTQPFMAVGPDSRSTETDTGQVFFSGHYTGGQQRYRWEPQSKGVEQLLDLDGDKMAKILAALGHKQRLDILRSVLREPLTGPELVERLNMGTTGQLYHHIKALQGADLLTQEERGGQYTIRGHRALPLLLLFAATSELLETSDYLALAEVRDHTSAYLGSPSKSYDPHLLLRTVLENCVLEHQAGYCKQVQVFLHQDDSVTVSDDGRGIPVQALPHSATTHVQSVMTDLNRFIPSATLNAPDGDHGISIPVVNALSQKLTVEIRREGKVFLQDYKHGIPQSPLRTVGVTSETGTSITFLPDREIFTAGFDPGTLEQLVTEMATLHPQLSVQLHLN